MHLKRLSQLCIITLSFYSWQIFCQTQVADDIEKIQILAQKSLKENEIELAIKYHRKLKELLQIPSQKAKASVNLISLLLNAGKNSEAEKELKSAQEEFSQSIAEDPLIKAKFEYLQILVTLNSEISEEKIEKLKAILEPPSQTDPELNSAICLTLSIALAIKENWSEAIKYAKKIEDQSNDPETAETAKSIRAAITLLSGNPLEKEFKSSGNNENPEISDIVILYAVGAKEDAVAALNRLDKGKYKNKLSAFFPLLAISHKALENNDPQTASLFLESASQISYPEFFKDKIVKTKAQIKIKKGELKEAVKIYEDFLENNPKNPASNYIKIELAKTLLASSENKKAKETFIQIINSNSVNDKLKSEVLYDSVRSFISLKDYNTAEEILSKAQTITQLNSSPALLILSAEISSAKGNFLNAANIYAKIANNFPELYVSAIHSQIKSLFKAENPSATLKLINANKETFSKSPFHQEILFIEAVCLKKTAKSDDALNLLLDFSEKYPNSNFAPQSLYEAAEIHIENANFAKAAELLDTIATKYKDSEISQIAEYRKIYALLMSGQNHEAEKTALKISETWPKSKYSALALIWLADNYRENKKISEAETLYLKIKTQYQEFKDIASDALLEAAKIAIAAKDNQRAVLFLDEIVEKYPDQRACSYAYFLKGDMLSENAEYNKAIPFFIKAAMRKPSSILAASSYGRIGDCYFSMASANAAENLIKASEYYSKIIGMQVPTEFWEQAMFKLGRCEEKIGDTGSALAKYKELIANCEADWMRGNKRSSVWLAKAATSAIRIYLEKGDPLSLSEAEKIYYSAQKLGIESITQMRENIDAAMEKIKKIKENPE